MLCYALYYFTNDQILNYRLKIGYKIFIVNSLLPAAKYEAITFTGNHTITHITLSYKLYKTLLRAGHNFFKIVLRNKYINLLPFWFWHFC